MGGVEGGAGFGRGCLHAHAGDDFIYPCNKCAWPRRWVPNVPARASGRAGGRQADSFCALRRALPSMPCAHGRCRDFVLSSPVPLAIAAQTLGGLWRAACCPHRPSSPLFSLLMYCHMVLTCMEEVRSLHKRTKALGERGACVGCPAHKRVYAFAVCL